MFRKNSKGQTLISMVVATAIIGIGFLSIIKANSATVKQLTESRRKAIAEAFAVELLEAFRSLSGAEMNQYLKGRALCKPVLNDLNADLPRSRLDNVGVLAARTYQAAIVDVRTMKVKESACNLTNYIYDLSTNPYDRYLVTVILSWKDHRISLSTVLPK